MDKWIDKSNDNYRKRQTLWGEWIKNTKLGQFNFWASILFKDDRLWPMALLIFKTSAFSFNGSFFFLITKDFSLYIVETSAFGSCFSYFYRAFWSY